MEAWQELCENGVRLSRRALVLNAFRRNPAGLTAWECSRFLDFSDPNAVRPRITELVEDGELFMCGVRRDPLSGSRNGVYKIVVR